MYFKVFATLICSSSNGQLEFGVHLANLIPWMDLVSQKDTASGILLSKNAVFNTFYKTLLRR